MVMVMQAIGQYDLDPALVLRRIHQGGLGGIEKQGLFENPLGHQTKGSK